MTGTGKTSRATVCIDRGDLMHASKPSITRAITHKFVRYHSFSFDVPGDTALLIQRSKADLRAEAGSSQQERQQHSQLAEQEGPATRGQVPSCPLMLPRGWPSKPFTAGRLHQQGTLGATSGCSPLSVAHSRAGYSAR